MFISRLKYLIIFTLIICTFSSQGQITSHIKEIKGMSGVDFMFHTYNKIETGISLTDYSQFEISYTDNYTTGDPNKSKGWQLVLTSLDELQATFGNLSTTPVSLSNISVSIRIKITTLPGYEDIKSPSITIQPNETIIWDSSTDVNLDLFKHNMKAMVYVTYHCSQLKNKTPNDYKTFFKFELRPSY